MRVAVDSVGICGTDLHFFRGSFPSPAGLIPGHEVGGVIDAWGDGVSDAPEPGSPVAVEPLTGCGTCGACRQGQANRCARRTLFGVSARGGLAEYLTVPADCVHPLPDGVAAPAGSMAEPLAVCVRGVRLGGVGLGHRVAVVGAGTIGLLTVLVARAAGAREVFVTARHPRQRELAAGLGGTVVDRLPTGLDAVLETVGGTGETLVPCVAATRAGGTVVLLGVFEGNALLPALDAATREIRVVGSNCYSRVDHDRDFVAALGLLATHREAVASLVTHRFPLDEVNEAFRTAADKTTGSVKVVIRPGG
ncbi:MAG: zinc-binding dehydrogenase [Acidimicrobiales bacterium]